MTYKKPIMKKILFAFLLIVFTAPALAQIAVYFENIADLPVMAGMAELKDQGAVFDKPEGRIVEAAAAGRVSEKEIFSYYNQVLPQLGWTMHEEGIYTRGNESLTLGTEIAAQGVVLHVNLTEKAPTRKP